MKILKTFSSGLMVIVFMIVAVTFGFDVPTTDAVTADINQIVFTSEPAGSIETMATGHFNLQFQNIANNEEQVDTSSVTVTLSTDSITGTFYNGNASGGCTTDLTPGNQITFNNGSANKAFCYSDTTAGTYTIIATMDSNNSVTGSTTITIDDPVVVTGPIVNTDSGEDFLTIQAAIDDADTDNGDTLIVEDGNYPEDLSINKSLTLKSNNTGGATVTGNGSNIVVNLLTDGITIDGLNVSALAANNYASTGIMINDSANVTVKNLSVTAIIRNNDSNAIDISGSSVEIDNVDISNFGKRGVRFINSTGSVSNSNIEGEIVDGNTRVQNLINVWGGSNVEIDSNELHNAISIGGNVKWTSPAIFVSSYGGSGDSNAVITGNNIHDVSTGIVLGSVYATNDASTATIMENNFNDLETGVVYESELVNSDITSNNFNSSVIVGIKAYEGDATFDPVTLSSNINAVENYWGDSFGPSGVFGEVNSSGSAVGEWVSYSPWLCSSAPSSQTTVDGNCSSSGGGGSLSSSSRGGELAGASTSNNDEDEGRDEENDENEESEEGEVLGESTTSVKEVLEQFCGPAYLNEGEYMHPNYNAPMRSVLKLQLFLKLMENMGIEITGRYDTQTVNWVKVFQVKYASDILVPWGITAPTGYTYLSTSRKVNELVCELPTPLLNNLVPDDNVTNNSRS